MAHCISNIDRQEGIEQAWHGLTVIREKISLVRNWLTEWEAVPTELFYGDKKPANLSVLTASDIPGHQIGLPYNPATYTPITNYDFLQLVAKSFEGRDFEIVSVGSVRERERVFVTIKVPELESLRAAGRDIQTFLNLGNGHGKTGVLWVNTSGIFTCCANTYAANLFEAMNKEAKDDNVREVRKHTKNLKVQLPDLAKIISKAVTVQSDFQKLMDKFARIPCTESMAHALFAGFIAPEKAEKLSTRSLNTVNRLGELFNDSSKGNDGNDMSDAYGAVTDYYSHESSGGEDTWKQYVSSEFGAGAGAKSDFLRLLGKDNERAETIALGEKLLLASKF